MRAIWRCVLLVVLLVYGGATTYAQGNGGTAKADTAKVMPRPHRLPGDPNGGGFGDDDQTDPSTGDDAGGAFGDSDQDNPSTEGGGGGFSDADMGGVPLGDEDDSPAIVFADDVVKNLCIDNWDVNGDGELSENEAAAVTDLSIVFQGNEDITSFEELSYFTGLTSIRASAFDGCSNLAAITIPCHVTSIGDEAFLGCFGLTSMEIPNGVTAIGEGAFKYCNGIASVSLPSSVTSIGNAAFSGCSSLTQVEADMLSPLSISSNTFSNRRNATLLVPSGSEAAYAAANYWKEFKSIAAIVEYVAGDANGDGIVTIADVVAVVDYIITNGNPTVNFVPSAADIDGIVGITIADAIAIANVVIGK